MFSKWGHSNKSKDSHSDSTNTRHSLIINNSESELEWNDVPFPYIKLSESELIPRYSEILKRGDGVAMEDLDALQLDLEKLLSSLAVRSRTFQTEARILERNEEIPEKRGRYNDKQSHTVSKRRRQDDKLLSEKESSGIRMSHHYRSRQNKNNLSSTLGSNLSSSGYSSGSGLYSGFYSSYDNEAPKLTVPKVSLPKNDAANRFWLLVNSYCRSVTQDDLNLLDQLIHDQSEEVDFKIPEIGKHYTHSWADQDIFSEKTLSLNGTKKSLKKTSLENKINCSVKNYEHFLESGCYPGLLTQQLVSGLLDDNVSNQHVDKKVFKATPVTNALCVQRRLHQIIIEQGLLESDDIPKLPYSVDEEIKRCKEKLASVRKSNLQTLNRLKEEVLRGISRQDIEKELEKVDKEIIDIYNKIASQKRLYGATVKVNEEDEIHATELLDKQARLTEKYISLAPDYVTYDFPEMLNSLK